MSTQNRQDFQWRPNDNSVKTNIRYDLEAAHWVKSFKAASTSNTITFLDALGTIGLILSFFVNILLFIFLLVVELVMWIKVKPHKEPREPEHLRLLTDEEIDAIDRELEKTRI